MTSTQFVSWMKRFVEQHKELDHVLDVFYNEVGIDLINFVDEVGFESFAVSAMELALNDETKLLSYFIYECNCNFEKFNDSVDCEGAEGTESPDVWSYEDLYFLITGGQHG